jgi:hypothetical protein
MDYQVILQEIIYLCLEGWLIAEKKEHYNYLKSPFRYYDSDLRPKKEFKAKVPMNDEHLKTSCNS